MKKIFIIYIFFLQYFPTFAQTEKLSVYFSFDKYNLDLNSKNKIDSVIRSKILKSVLIEAHCDSIGNNSYNDKLSQKRADAVGQYFVLNKINQAIIKTKGFGKRASINKNESETARALNRRADILIPLTDIVVSDKTDSIKNKIPETTIVDSSTLNIENIEVGSSLRLDNINFVGGQHVFLPGSYKALNVLLNTMKSNPSLVIELQGHVCCESGREDGWDYDTRTWNLSVNRARAVYDYLVKNGISSSRLTYKGFGSTHKLVEEVTEDDKTTNRRVEIKIINK